MKRLLFILCLLTSFTFASHTQAGVGGPPIVIIEDFQGCLRFSPNPSYDVIHFEVASEDDNIQNITVKDLSGNVLFTQNYAQKSCNINFSFLSEGEYILTTKTDKCEKSNQMLVNP
jgi:hypothetical protein